MSGRGNTPDLKSAAASEKMHRLIAMIVNFGTNLYAALMLVFAMYEVLSGPLWSLQTYFILHVCFFGVLVLETMYSVVVTVVALRSVDDRRNVITHQLYSLGAQAIILAGYWVMYNRYEATDSVFGGSHTFKDFREEKHYTVDAFATDAEIMDRATVNAHQADVVNLIRDSYAYTNWTAVQLFVIGTQMNKFAHFTSALIALKWPELVENQYVSMKSAPRQTSEKGPSPRM